MPDVVDLIKAQHRLMDGLLEQTQQEGADVAALLHQVAALLIPHSEAEESFVYPRIRDLDPQEGSEVTDGTAEHEHVEQLMRDLLAGEPGDPGFDGKLAAMIGELRHHVEEEEQELLPVLAEHAGDDERAELGARFAAQTGHDEAQSRSRSQAKDLTRDELYEKAREQGVHGRSAMTKDELADSVE